MSQKRYRIPKKRFLTGISAGLFLALTAHGLTPLDARANRSHLLYWHGDRHVKKVALTFDDGPNQPYTAEILKILKENDVRATFFLVGKNVEGDPQTARDIVAAGHFIGNHSYDHHNLLTRTNAQVRREILMAEKAIEAATGQRTVLFRPPYGDKNTLTVNQTQKLGYVMVEWSVSGEDWRRPGADRIVRNIVKSVRNGAIILLHDGDKARHGDRSQTVEALPNIIDQLRQKGYEFVTVPELLQLQPDDLLAISHSRSVPGLTS
jgi:polysaccharide deacetylase family sporulation protein PdaB